MVDPGSGNISKANAKLLMQLMAGDLKYQGKEWDVAVVFTEHPFMLGNAALWCGAPGITDSVGIWLDQIRQRLLDEPDEIEVEFRVFACEVAPGHYDYIADIWFDPGEHLLVGGINNYSGTGGAGGKLVMQVADALEDLLEPNFERKGLFQRTQAQFDAALRKHSDAIIKERKENEDGTA